MREPAARSKGPSKRSLSNRLLSLEGLAIENAPPEILGEATL